VHEEGQHVGLKVPKCCIVRCVVLCQKSKAMRYKGRRSICRAGNAGVTYPAGIIVQTCRLTDEFKRNGEVSSR
jgi:hypothetical protein